MIRCKGQCCFALVIIVFLWLFDLCKNILFYSEYMFIFVVIAVLLACVLCGSFHLHYPTRVRRYGTQPPKRPTGLHVVPSPRYLHQVASPLTGWRPRGLIVFFADFVILGTAVVTASVILMELLKVIIRRGIAASLADLKFA